MKYTGQETGRQLVHRRVIEAPIFQKMKYHHDFYMEIYKKEKQSGLEALAKLVPEAVHRVGCTCCYGDGPDIDFGWPVEQPDGSGHIDFYVDFDFEIPKKDRC
jgi:hypothetical protein